MAQKKITDLQLRSDFDETCNIPVDDAVQTWRVTGEQIKDFILANENVEKAMLETAVQNALIPVGTILPMAVSSTPSGFLPCDGSAVSRSTYASLFSAIGTTHGQGDNSTTFNVPDYRGRFLRGVADGQTTDPDRASRTAMATGGNTGDNVGSIQSDQYTSHTHSPDGGNKASYYGTGGGGNVGWYNGTNFATATSVGSTLSNSGGNETRPKNANVKFFVKY